MPTVRTNDVDTYYERRGDGPTVVFVHAGILDHHMWEPQVDALAPEYETVVYDLRGHGRTGGSERERYSADLFAEDLLALLDALAVDCPVVVGHSLGGLVAQTFAATHPERVRGLVLAGTFSPRILSRTEWFLRRVALPGIVLPVRLVGIERIERLNVWVAERVAPGSGGDYDRVAALRDRGPTMSTAEFGKVMDAYGRFHESGVDLGDVAAPTLVLYGERDLPFVVRQAAELSARIPDATVEVVPDAGHAANLDNPTGYTGALRRFLEGLSPDETDEQRGERTQRQGDD